MRVIEVEILGFVEVYKDNYNMPKEWHEQQVKRIADTAHLRMYKRVYARNRRRSAAIDQTIEDLFIKSRQGIKPQKKFL